MNTKTLLKKISVVAMTSVLMVGTTFSLTGCGQTSSSKTASDASSSSEDLTTIRIGVMTGDLSQEAVEIGIDKGIFANYGLDVKVTEYAAGINTVDALTMNNEDMGIVADYAWVNRLGTVADKTTLRLFTRYSTSTGEGNVLVINKKLASGVDELSGQKIATIAGTVWDYFVGKLIEEKGLKDVTIVKTSSAAEMYAAYSSGKVAAFFASGETLTKATADKNTIKALTLKDLGLSIDEYYAANESYL